jgi:hypothetical protein
MGYDLHNPPDGTHGGVMRRIGWMVPVSIVFVMSCASDEGVRGEGVVEDDGVDVVRLGVLEYVGESDGVFVMPEHIVTAEPFTLRIHTYNGLCDEQESVDVEYADTRVVVSPYVHTKIERGTVCPDALQRLEHRAEIVLEASGEHEIVVRGRRVALGVDEEIERVLSVIAE